MAITAPNDPPLKTTWQGILAGIATVGVVASFQMELSPSTVIFGILLCVASCLQVYKDFNEPQRSWSLLFVTSFVAILLAFVGASLDTYVYSLIGGLAHVTFTALSYITNVRYH